MFKVVKREVVANLTKWKSRYVKDWDGLAPNGARLWSDKRPEEEKAIPATVIHGSGMLP